MGRWEKRICIVEKRKTETGNKQNYCIGRYMNVADRDF